MNSRMARLTPLILILFFALPGKGESISTVMVNSASTIQDSTVHDSSATAMMYLSVSPGIMMNLQLLWKVRNYLALEGSIGVTVFPTNFAWNGPPNRSALLHAYALSRLGVVVMPWPETQPAALAVQLLSPNIYSTYFLLVVAPEIISFRPNLPFFFQLGVVVDVNKDEGNMFNTFNLWWELGLKLFRW